jgi:hypothetical protein
VVAAGPNWTAASRQCEKKAWPAGPVTGNQPERELGDRKTFSFIKIPFILSNIFDSKFKFELRMFPKRNIK